jgi:chaperone modulatory protein CbpM
MLTDQFIALKEFCGYHNVEYTFVYSLCEADLVKVTTISGEIYVHSDYIATLEKMVRLHLDLGINSEGVETILYLLNKIDCLKSDINKLQNKLEFYEND